MSEKFILDACCGGKCMWFNRNNPNTLYIDIRREKPNFSDKVKKKIRKDFEVNPDIIMDFRDLGFEDNSFKLVVFDPPHLKTLGETSYMRKIYGCLDKKTYKKDILKGLEECWRVLEDYGVLIFKWNEAEIPANHVLKQFKQDPLFGSTLGNNQKTKWFCFMKIPEEAKR